ncbi:MAG: cold shock domain-containing protein [Chloroflexi bacterium]|nr:cold shock domain-containing protein [Chloroflexota bacterium]
MPFSDKLIVCSQCGTRFVFTVSEQRAIVDAGLDLIPPDLCPACRGEQITEVAAPPRSQREDVNSRGRAEGGRYSHEFESQPRREGAEPRPSRAQPGVQHARGSRDTQPPRRGRPDAESSRRGGESSRERGPKLQVPSKYADEGFVARLLGHVKWFDPKRSFGFIAVEDGSEIFFHYTSVDLPGPTQLEEGQSVEFEIEMTAKGPQAVHVLLLDEWDRPILGK